ncbi:MAG: type II toxin-antitoxin system VapC family toxin [Verrucomicrobiota bacterium]
MDEILNVDTCFLIDLEREQRRKIDGPAGAFLRNHLETEFRLSAVALGEFAAGFDRPDHPRLEVVRKGYEIMATDEETALIYARLYRHLQESKCLIGANDLWIAAGAMRNGASLVTRNVDEFLRVPGLRVVAY